MEFTNEGTKVIGSFDRVGFPSFILPLRHGQKTKILRGLDGIQARHLYLLGGLPKTGHRI
jgi:hypothetical protein